MKGIADSLRRRGHPCDKKKLAMLRFIFVSETSCECKHSVKFLKTKRVKHCFTLFCCGEKGIRTPGTRKSTTVFETAPFDHSGISPCEVKLICLLAASVAEKEGFEPPEPSRVQRFSRPPHSTTLPFLRAVQKYYKLNSRQIYFPYFLHTPNTIIISILNTKIA